MQAADIIQPDITSCGGLLEAKKIAAWADAYSLLVAPHNVRGPVATAAALHLVAYTTNFAIQEHFNDEAHVTAAAPGNPEVVDGCFALPHGPGLGVELALDVVQSPSRRRIFFNLISPEWHRHQATVEGGVALPAGRTPPQGRVASRGLEKIALPADMLDTRLKQKEAMQPGCVHTSRSLWYRAAEGATQAMLP